MRTDLKANSQVVKVETDVDEKRVFVELKKGTNARSIFDKVAETNNKLKDWEFVDQ